MVICTVLAKSGEGEWNKIWQLLLNSGNNPSEREDLLNVIGCTKNPELLKVRSLGPVAPPSTT